MATASSDIDETIRTIVVLAVFIPLALVILSNIGGVVSQDGVQTSVNIESGSGTVPAPNLLAVDNVTTVQQSLGTGVELDGTNSYRASRMPDIDAPFELSVYTELDSGVATDARSIMTYDGASAQLVLYHNGTSGVYVTNATGAPSSVPPAVGLSV